ncbi:MAG: DMT family transporter [Phycisphaeraceae bacterium]|nr:MAG: DMT family transporter [Phycisphaeraceae bacterium]
MRPRALKADAMLLLVALFWGAGFAAQRVAMDSMGPFTFNAARYAIGAVLLVPLLGVVKARGRRFDRRTLVVGLLLGVVMAAASGLQQVGLVTTTASRAGFITGLYVILVPALGLLFGQRLFVGHITGAAFAVAGLWLLSGHLSGGLVRGDVYVLGCAALWAVHVVVVAHVAAKADALALSIAQFVVVAVLSSVLAIARETPTLAGVGAGMLPVLYSGVFAIGVAFTFQVLAQRDAPPTHAAVIMSLEAVFGALAGVALLGERLSAAETAGCGLMFAGMLACQLWPHKRTPAERAELTDPVR